MTDRYADLRAALDAGPTLGPWFADEHGKIWRRNPKELYENGGGVAGDRALATANVGWHGEGCVGFPAKANASLIAAANPETIRALLADYDRMRDAAHQMHALYPNVWDRADGCLVVFPENVERFDAAFEGLRAALAQEQGGSDANGDR